MTSYSPPDYYADMKMSCKDFKTLKGHTFTVDVYRPSFKKPVKGMLMIPANINNDTHLFESWLWIDSVKSIIPKNEALIFHLLENCNPLHQFNEIDDFNLKTGLKITGVVR